MPRLANRETVARGATVVAVTTFAIRLLGALYRPIVVHLFRPYDGADGLAGMGLAQAPSSAYSVVLSFTSIGFNVALARLVAEARAQGNNDDAREIFSASVTIMAILGTLGALGMIVAAPWLETASNMKGSTIGYIATAPAILVISLVAAMRGFFQGLQAMTPNAHSQLLEAFVRIGSGIALVYFLVRLSVPLGAAGLNLGDSIGASVSLGYLIWLYYGNRAAIWGEGTRAKAGRSLRRTWEIALVLFRNAFPISLINAALPLMIYLDAFVIGHYLPGATAGTVQAVYGELTAGLALIMLPTVVTGGLASALIPALAEASARKENTRLQNLARSSYRLTLLAGWPAAVGLAVLGSMIFQFLYGTAQGSEFMWSLALSVLPLMLQQTSSAILQGLGRMNEPLVSLAIGVAAKLLLSMLLVPRFGGVGVAWGTAVGFLISAALNIRGVARLTGVSGDWMAQGLRSGAAGAVMGVGVLLLARLLAPRVHGRWSEGVVVMLAVGAGAAIYGVAVLALRGMEREDLARLPWLGPRLIKRVYGEG